MNIRKYSRANQETVRLFFFHQTASEIRGIINDLFNFVPIYLSESGEIFHKIL